MYGAPPRAWGERRRLRQLLGRGRSTPTCVGRTLDWSSAGARCPEHSHVRGEDVHRDPVAGPDRGAPPRAWGGRPRPPGSRQRHRSTPTCVGRTPSASAPRRAKPEHPHVRGEDIHRYIGCRAWPGAPPRAWGGLVHLVEARRVGRSTPTCVGRTAAGHVGGVGGAEHPHVRGEDAAASWSSTAACGAPPRAWGGRRRRVHAAPAEGSTPTCVGRTTPPDPAPDRPAEHPHVRGEDPPPGTRNHARGGAPPRAWGGHFASCGFTSLPARFLRPALRRRVGLPWGSSPRG